MFRFWFINILFFTGNSYLYNFGRPKKSGPWICTKKAQVVPPNNQNLSVWPLPPINPKNNTQVQAKKFKN